MRALYSCEHWEIIKPSVSELSREVRTNILCTVKGCGKVLPNPPALNMHLVKSHGVQVRRTWDIPPGGGGYDLYKVSLCE